MFKYFLLHKYTLVVLVAAVAFVMYSSGYPTTALVAAPLAVSFIIAKETYKTNTLSVAYESGVFIGIASFFWIWSLIAFPLLLIFLYVPMKVTSFRMFWASCLGLVTPLWCYSPYWVFNNTEYLTTLMLRVKESLI